MKERDRTHLALHLTEERPDWALCGIRLKGTDLLHTDDEAEFQAREGSRCKRCWRIYANDCALIGRPVS